MAQIVYKKIAKPKRDVKVFMWFPNERYRVKYGPPHEKTNNVVFEHVRHRRWLES